MNSKDGFATADTVVWESSDERVVKIIIDNPAQQHIAKLQRIGPGYSTVTAVITKNGTKYTISCQVKVQLNIDYINFTIATTTQERVLQLEAVSDTK